MRTSLAGTTVPVGSGAIGSGVAKEETGSSLAVVVIDSEIFSLAAVVGCSALAAKGGTDSGILSSAGVVTGSGISSLAAGLIVSSSVCGCGFTGCGWITATVGRWPLPSHAARCRYIPSQCVAG